MKKDLITKRDSMSALTLWDGFDRFFDEFYKMFDTIEQTGFLPSVKQDLFDQMQPKSCLPKVNVIDNGNEYVLEAALAGFKKEDISLELKDNILFLKVESNSTDETNNQNYLRREIAKRSFKRAIRFPEEINTKAISTDFANGLLTIKLTKKVVEEKSNVVKIDIN